MHAEWLTQLNRKMIEKRLKHADLIIGNSDFITNGIRNRFPQFAERCCTVHNGVDVDYFTSQASQNIPGKNDVKELLFLGRLSPEKGVHLLLDAFKKTVMRYPEVQLKLVGPFGSLGIQFFLALSDDPKISELKSFYKQNYILCLQRMLSSDIINNVCFTGPSPVPRNQLPSLYANASLFIFPPIWNEPFGMPVLEAMAAGVPVISTLSGGIPEIVVDGETGLLVERGDASALVEAILRLLSDEELRKSMGKAARKRAVELFSWERVVENLLNQYKKICEGTE
jgi:glycosyltransferase involved in cell wall biosynthesis